MVMKNTHNNKDKKEESLFEWGFRKCWIENNPIVKQLIIGIVSGFALITIGYFMIKKEGQK